MGFTRGRKKKEAPTEGGRLPRISVEPVSQMGMDRCGSKINVGKLCEIRVGT